MHFCPSRTASPVLNQENLLLLDKSRTAAKHEVCATECDAYDIHQAVNDIRTEPCANHKQRLGCGYVQPSHLGKVGPNGDSYLQVGTHAVTYTCRTALQAHVIDVIHSLVEEQISPVLVRLATTGPQVCAPPIDYLLGVTMCMG